jgi:hypothetical protein
MQLVVYNKLLVISGYWTRRLIASRLWLRRPLKWKKLAETTLYTGNTTGYHMQPVVQSTGAGQRPTGVEAECTRITGQSALST